MRRYFTDLAAPRPAEAGRAGGPAADRWPPEGSATSPWAPPEKEFDAFEGRLILVDLATQLQMKGREEFFEGRNWLEEQLCHRRAIGFDMEWRPDRESGSDHPVALMQFADGGTALLLRTHQTARWLPQLVREVLTSTVVKKICVGYDGADRRKLESSFGFKLGGVVELAELAVQKGLRHTGLKKLAEELGWRMRKEPRIARSDWQAPCLTPDQVQYAADDAYFTYRIFGALEEMSDVVPVEAEPVVEVEEEHSVLSLKPGWAEQGIVRRHDGLWCSLCSKGPMLHSEVMERHIESRGHARKVQVPADPEAAPPVEVPEALALRGLACGHPGHSRVLPGQYRCTFCDAGPFQTLEAAKAHLRGRQHLKRERQREGQGAEVQELPTELEAAGIEVCADAASYRCAVCDAGPFLDLQSVRQHVNGRQHQRRSTPPAAAAAEPAAQPVAARVGLQPEDLEGLPGYVDLWAGELMCALCATKANNLRTMYQHICSERHSKACRKMGRPELVFVQERGRLEELETGLPVCRGDDSFDEDLLPPPRPPPAQATRSAEPDGRWQVHFDDEPPRPPPARVPQSAEPDGRRQVRFNGEPPPEFKDAATARAWASWSGLPKKAFRDVNRVPDVADFQPRVRVAEDPEFTPEKPLAGLPEADDLVDAQDCRVAVADVVVPPPGWDWDPSTCMAVQRGEVIQVLHVEGDWLYGQSVHRFEEPAATTREGWLPASALGERLGLVDAEGGGVVEEHEPPSAPSAGWEPQEADDGWAAEPAGVAGGIVLCEGWAAPVRQQVAAAPRDVDARNFLRPGVGDEVVVQRIWDGWVWGLAGRSSGWIPTWAFQDRETSWSASASPTGGIEHCLLRVDSPVPGPPVGMHPANFLVLAAGEAVLVEYVSDDGWIWGCAGGHSGWAPVAALGRRLEC